MTAGPCAKCGKHGYLMRLHGDQGGPLMCPVCCGEWNAKHTRGRRYGRVAQKALDLYLDYMPSMKHDDRSDLIKASVVLSFLNDGKVTVALGSNSDDGCYDLTSELLADVLKLTHPDRHPPERHDLAKRVTQQLLELQPFTFPAPKPKPAPKYTPPPRNGFDQRPHGEFKQPSRRYPCELCAATVPYFYCDLCKAEWTKRREAEREREREKQREQYRRRQQRKRWRRPPKPCAAGCGTNVNSIRKDAKYCSPACRQRAHRNRVTAKTKFPARTASSRNGEAAP